jgi:hypothetical protein
MRPTRIIGLCLLAVCAMFALTATSASAANLPGYGKCEPSGTGEFTNTSCTKRAKKPKTGKDEWIPIAAAVPFTSAKEKKTGEAVLEGESGSKISCLNQTEKEGEYGPGNEVKNVVGEFTGCKTSGIPCKSEGAKAEEIDTKKLHGEPGVVTFEPANEEKDTLGNDLRAQVGESLAEFSCGPAAVTVHGGVVVKAAEDGKANSNKMSNKIEVEFVAVPKGKQEPREWTPNGGGVSNAKNEKIVEHLESSLGGGKFEESGQTLTTIQETAGGTKLELRICAAKEKC